ncbi:hypothetical protein [Isobaculum melis]|uniref:Uncharacterized protein n=1 Tax=Isobaculum melis TaxID=142588 RepID=A0A1H9TP95_9LACT|nr:hypothetical protein [Isobaculum melis]SER98887.1 hypothetical protein SAMN04488559_11532 [Isobaculum melis]
MGKLTIELDFLQLAFLKNIVGEDIEKTKDMLQQCKGKYEKRFSATETRLKKMNDLLMKIDILISE